MEIGIGTQFAQRRYNTIVQVVEIIGETKTQWILSNGERLRKKDLWIVGDTRFNSSYYGVLKDSDIEEIKRVKILSQLKNISFSDYKTETIKKVLEILEND